MHFDGAYLALDVAQVLVLSREQSVWSILFFAPDRLLCIVKLLQGVDGDLLRVVSSGVARCCLL